MTLRDAHSSLFLASQSWMHAQLHGGSLVSTESIFFELGQSK